MENSNFYNNKIRPQQKIINAKINQTNKTTLKCDKQKAEIKKQNIIFSRNEKQQKKTQLQEQSITFKTHTRKAKTNK